MPIRPVAAELVVANGVRLSDREIKPVRELAADGFCRMQLNPQKGKSKGRQNHAKPKCKRVMDRSASHG
jgi:hypothetical protein